MRSLPLGNVLCLRGVFAPLALCLLAVQSSYRNLNELSMNMLLAGSTIKVISSHIAVEVVVIDGVNGVNGIVRNNR